MTFPNLPPTLPWVKGDDESDDYVVAYDQMATLERAWGGAYGLRRAHSLPPEQLTGEFVESVRWLVDIRPHSQGFKSPVNFFGHPGMVRYHDHTLKVFVAGDGANATQERVMRKLAWVPREWDAMYAANRTLGGTCREALLLDKPTWVRQSYGRLPNGTRQWYWGWLLTIGLRLQYVMQAG